MVRVTAEPIRIDELLAEVESDSSGAVVVFVGRVRNHSGGKRVVRMRYEAYASMATTEMEKIAEELGKRWPIAKAAMVHRTGELAVGEVSVAIAVSSAHRQEAFAACKYAIDELKQRVPIWKKEFFEGDAAWVEGIVPQEPKHSG